MALKNGAVVVTVDLGSGQFKATVTAQGFTLDDNHWHHLVVKRKTREVSLLPILVMYVESHWSVTTCLVGSSTLNTY